MSQRMRETSRREAPCVLGLWHIRCRTTRVQLTAYSVS